MSDSQDNTRLQQVPVEERLKLIELLWDSIETGKAEVAMPGWHMDIAEKRLSALDAGTSVGSSWSDVRRRILGST
jgi:putative addiction module component (TIGR02574 family)